MQIIYVEEWVEELCQRGYLRAYQVPEIVDFNAADFDPQQYPCTDEEVEFLGATDATMPDPENHPGWQIVHGTDKDRALQECQHGENR